MRLWLGISRSCPHFLAMKLFAYEHPSGPVHEVEVTLGDTAHWRRLRRSMGWLQPPRPAAAAMGETRRRSTVVRLRGRRARRRRSCERLNASTRPRRRHARPPQVLQLKSKIEQAMQTSVWESGSMAWRFTKVHAILNSLRDFHTGPTRRSSRPRSSTSPSAARSSTTTPRRSRLLESRRTTRCAPSPSR